MAGAQGQHRRYLIVVPASERALYAYLERRFRDDREVEVVLDDRRTASRPGGPEATRVTTVLGGVVVVRRGRAAPATIERGDVTAHSGRGAAMDSADVLDDRQRVDRWLEESQYLLGRIIPGYLDDRERLRHRLAAAEQEGERMRQEIDDLRKELAGLQGELQFHRSEQNAAADAFAAVLSQLTDLQKPLAEVHRRLQTGPAAVSNLSHA
jgi:hypothetical protein